MYSPPFVFAVLCTLLAVASAALLLRVPGLPALERPGRYATLDGLRGYLAFFVFLHHAAIWFTYLKTVEWTGPSRLYTHLGQASVALFFMVTGFLFFAKLLDARARPVDWLRLGVSRLLRLTPLYLVVMCAMLATVALVSGGELREAPATLARGVGQWLGFSIFGQPDLNGLQDTRIIVAGVIWSLPYEWLFYCLLPLMALAMGQRVHWRYVAVGAIGGATILLLHHEWLHLATFGGGMAAAVLVRYPRFCAFARSRMATCLVLGCMALLAAAFQGSYHPAALGLVALVFALIAGGNDLLGVLRWPASRLLGQVSYGIYLLHGLVLYGVFRLLLDADLAAGLGLMAYWALAAACVPVIVLLSFATFHWVEAPAMRRVAAATAWCRGLRRPRASGGRVAAGRS